MCVQCPWWQHGKTVRWKRSTDARVYLVLPYSRTYAGMRLHTPHALIVRKVADTSHTLHWAWAWAMGNGHGHGQRHGQWAWA